MPDEMRADSKLYGVELDSISGRIAKQLYPEDNIQIKGFEKTTFKNNSFDVVIGNIPLEIMALQTKPMTNTTSKFMTISPQKQ